MSWTAGTIASDCRCCHGSGVAALRYQGSLGEGPPHMYTVWITCTCMLVSLPATTRGEVQQPLDSFTSPKPRGSM